MFDFANSSYTTVVTTAIFNAYFVKTVASGVELSTATLYLTCSLGLANLLVVLTAPVVGAIADAFAVKKRFLFVSSLACVVCTACLSLIHQGDVALAMTLLVLSNFAFGTSENLIAAFLPEIATPERMGRISAFGWTLGYIGGIAVLGACLAYVSWAQKAGQTPAQFVPVTMLFVAVIFTSAAAPTFIWLKERAKRAVVNNKLSEIASGAFKQVFDTIADAKKHRDLFTFLLSLLCYSCGSTTVVALAAVYAEQVMGFKTSESIILIMVVNVTAAVGAFIFGFIQDKVGSVRTIAVTLALWSLAIFIAFATTNKEGFWLAANIMGIAMGASASAGRALVGRLSPAGRSAEFFGLWGLSVKLSAIIGPMTYGLVTYLSVSNYRLALLSTLMFFILGLVIVFFVDEKRGRQQALLG
ncbi:MFS transporter [bacterium]|nr:MFS transporter [bacterium]MBP9808096.1 MFS transporter [bacterium]